jgi:hypothetical protein
MNSTAHLCRNLLAQIEKQLKLIISLSDFSLNPERTCTAYSKKMHNQKKKHS